MLTQEEIDQLVDEFDRETSGETACHSAIYCSCAEFIERTKKPGIFIWLTEYLGFSFVAWEIKRHTKNSYNHVMIQPEPGVLCSQDWTFRKTDPMKYLNGKYRVKLVRVPATPAQGGIIDAVASILMDIAPRYDWMGIIGFLFNRQKWIQFRSRYYCSEAVLSILNKAGMAITDTALSPGDIDRMIEKQEWEVAAIYDPLIK
jgi:hypothetical protein